jgi:hypothetical protein
VSLTVVKGAGGVVTPALSAECRRGKCDLCADSACVHRCHGHAQSGPAADELERAA